jgi:hypothetical protein
VACGRPQGDGRFGSTSAVNAGTGSFLRHGAGTGGSTTSQCVR